MRKDDDKVSIISMSIDHLQIDLAEYRDGTAWTLYINDKRDDQQHVCQEVSRKNIAAIVEDAVNLRSDVFFANAIEGKYLK